MADIKNEPKKSASDVAYGIAKAALSAVPVAGAPTAEVLGAIFGPPVERRREKWLGELVRAVTELQQKVADVTPEKLSENEAFVTTVMRASEVAVRTHEDEKIQALRNAVVNAALPDAPQDTLQQIFLNHVDNLTSWHLRVLAFFRDPRAWGRQHQIEYPHWTAGSPASVLEHSMPELVRRRDFYDQLVRDLEARGLFAGGGIHAMVTGEGMFASRVTPLGGQFLQFISKR